MYISSGAAERTNGFAQTNATSGGGGGLSAGFLKALQSQMEGWLRALKDSKISQGEVSLIKNMSDSSMLSALASVENDGEVAFDGSAAYLFASLEVSKVTNQMNWVFTYQSNLSDLYNKATNMLTG